MPDTPCLDTPVQALKGVGPALTRHLNRAGLYKVRDLLFHLPLRYEDRSCVVPLSQLQPGQHAVVVIRVENAQLRYGRRRSLLVSASDGTGRIHLRFFHFSKAQMQGFVPGQWLRCYGEARPGPNSAEMVHPQYRRVQNQAEGEALEEGFIPIYPSTEGLNQGRLRGLIGQALKLLDDGETVRELIPQEITRDAQYPELASALLLIHAPDTADNLTRLEAGTHPSQRRLAFEELLAHHLSMRKLRQSVQRHKAPVCDNPGSLIRQLRSNLPFELTAAQKRVLGEILTDMSGGSPMQRLVQGDVGSGKTVVAAMAACAALESGFQVAMMAPTELLAEQHYKSLSGWLQPLGIHVGLFKNAGKKSDRARLNTLLAQGEIKMAVGTHALIQEGVRFDDLGLIIIDEQHRFGVHQRLTLRDKGSGRNERPHQLVMTATPIPRTLAMSLYADMDTSLIDELPPGRKPVTTVTISDQRRDDVLKRVADYCRDGRQAYWVCTLVEESDKLQARAAEETAASLQSELPGLQIGLVHGRMKAQEKDATMQAFIEGATDLLVATTVIEVGVDVPNATLMIIDNAERLGLSQLHQLRGRVGRGSQQSHCLLVYHPPLNEIAQQRLQVMRQTQDGFRIAAKDLELRGPGEVMGTRQTGLAQMRIADLLRDADLLPRVQAAADRMLLKHVNLVDPLIQRWLSDAQQQYMEV